VVDDDDARSRSSYEASIKRSLDAIQSMMDPVYKRGQYDCPAHDFFCPVPTRAWSQEEKDHLLAFAKKYILGGFDDGGANKKRKCN